MKRFSILITLLTIFNLLQAQEEYPEFPNGMPACMEFIESNLNYSLLDSVPDNTEGKVVIAIQLDTLGNIFSTQVKKGLHPLLDEEALRIIKLMPRWKPYRINGVAKEWHLTVAVNFLKAKRPTYVPCCDWFSTAKFQEESYDKIFSYLQEFITNYHKEEFTHVFADSTKLPRGIYLFLVTDKGKIREIKTMRESNRTLEKIARHALSQMPDWTPAVNLKGDTISCRYIIPINWTQIYHEIQNKEKERMQVLLENENRLDSIWRKEDIWNKGLSFIEQDIDTTGIEAPRWAVWNTDLEGYFTARMKYPAHLLEKNQAGYSTVMFSLDTLGLPRGINILTTIHKDFDKEVIRLVKELPHCLPCRDKNGKRIECFYTVYVPFLPQHYRDRVKADSIGEENLKQMFVTWESPSRFQDGNPYAVTEYINERLAYNPELLGDKKETRGIYTIRIDSYGEVTEVETIRSCGISEWDAQVMEIIKGMPRWTPEVNYHGRGEYRCSVWTVTVKFRNEVEQTLK